MSGINNVFGVWLARVGALTTPGGARIFRWRGTGAGTKTDWDDGRNWIDLYGNPYGQAVYPGTGSTDAAWFDAALGAGSSPSTNLDRSADTPLIGLVVGNEYDGSLGTSGNALKFDMATSNYAECLLDATDATNIYLNGEGTNGILRLQVINCAPTLNLSGKLGTVELLKGTDVEYSASVSACTSLAIGFRSARTSDCVVDIASSSTLPSSVRCHGGTVTCGQAVTTLFLSGGEWTQTTGDITTLDMDGGTFYWGHDEPTTIVAGNITTARIKRGTLDASLNLQSRTITLAAIYAAGRLILTNGLGTAEVTEYELHGGAIEWDLGTRLKTYA